MGLSDPKDLSNHISVTVGAISPEASLDHVNGNSVQAVSAGPVQQLFTAHHGIEGTG